MKYIKSKIGLPECLALSQTTIYGKTSSKKGTELKIIKKFWFNI